MVVLSSRAFSTSAERRSSSEHVRGAGGPDSRSCCSASSKIRRATTDSKPSASLAGTPYLKGGHGRGPYHRLTLTPSPPHSFLNPLLLTTQNSNLHSPGF